MLLSNLPVMLHASPADGSGSVRTGYIVGQQYADKFPEVTMVELTYGKDTPHFQYRFELIRDMEAGTAFFTAKLHNGRIEPIAKLNLVMVEGTPYLRVDTNPEPRDDLGNVPEI